MWSGNEMHHEEEEEEEEPDYAEWEEEEEEEVFDSHSTFSLPGQTGSERREEDLLSHYITHFTTNYSCADIVPAADRKMPMFQYTNVKRNYQRPLLDTAWKQQVNSIDGQREHGLKEKQEEDTPPHIKEEQEEGGPPFIKEEPEEVALTIIKEEEEEVALCPIKEEPEEAALPLMIKVEQDEGGAPQVEEEAEPPSVQENQEEDRSTVEDELFSSRQRTEDTFHISAGDQTFQIEYTDQAAAKQPISPPPPPPKKRKRYESQRRSDRKRDRGRISIGVAFARWRRLMNSCGMKTDAQFATVLLDIFEKDPHSSTLMKRAANATRKKTEEEKIDSTRLRELAQLEWSEMSSDEGNVDETDGNNPRNGAIDWTEECAPEVATAKEEK